MLRSNRKLMNFDRSHNVIAPKCYSFFDVKTSAKDGQIRKIQPCIWARLKIDTSVGLNSAPTTISFNTINKSQRFKNDAKVVFQ